MNLIDKDEMLKKFRKICSDTCEVNYEENEFCYSPCEEVKAIIDAPAVDAVEVVRCKDCSYMWRGYCDRHEETYFVDDDDFCSFGNRKDDVCD